MKKARSNRGSSLHWSAAKEFQSLAAERKRDWEILKTKAKMEAADLREVFEENAAFLSAWEVRFLTCIWESSSKGRPMTQRQRFFVSKIQKEMVARRQDVKAAAASEPKAARAGVRLRKKGMKDE